MMNKTKKQTQSEETRERIVQAATQFLISRSYYGATISTIATEVGLTKGAIYHHFRSKEELVLVIVKRVKLSWFQSVGKEVLLKSKSVDQLETLILLHSKFLKNDPTMCLVLSNLMSELELLSEDIMIEIKEIYSEMLSFIQNIIEKGQKNNEFRNDLDAENTAFTLVGILRWMGCSPLFTLLDFKQEKLANNTIQLFISSMKN